jgi:hypothetical protein
MDEAEPPPPRIQRLDPAGGSRGRNRPEHIVANGLLHLRALHIHDRRFARDRNRLFEGPDFQFTVHRRDERAGDFNPLALDGTETRQCERHGIGARTQVDNPVLAGRVGDDGSDFFNQRGAGGFDRHAWQDAARSVLDDAGNGPGKLCVGRRR